MLGKAFHLLLVEDNVVYADLINSAFASCDREIRITSATSLKAARAYLREDLHPDLLLIDFFLPDGKWTDLLPPDGEKPAFPVVVLIDEGNETEAAEVLETGALDYVAKVPGTQDEIPHIVERALREWEHIARRETAEKKLRESEANLRTIGKAALDALAMMDASGHFAYWNPAAEKMFGYSREEILGRDIHEVLVPPMHQHRAREGMARFLKTGQGHALGKTFELEGLRKDGTRIPVEISLSPTEVEGQRGAVAIIRDITRRKHAEDELARYQEHLETLVEKRTADLAKANQQLTQSTAALKEANRSLREKTETALATERVKSQFLTNMSHELRTPIHGILSFAKLAMRKAEEEGIDQLHDFMQAIRDSGHVLLSLVNDLLDLSKLESGKMIFAFQPLNLHTLLLTVVNEFGGTLSERRLSVHCDSPDFDPTVMADRKRLMQVARNLLGNAIKFSPDGENIQIELARDNSAIRVSVADRGKGIPPEELETIFNPFVQSSQTGNVGGTGLGLSICREIISAHQGRIWAKNQPEGGCVFSFEIPPAASRNAPGPETEWCVPVTFPAVSPPGNTSTNASPP